MKIKPEHYEMLEQAIKPQMELTPFKDYEAKGLSAMRWRWDLTFRAWWKDNRLSYWISELIYPYANDEHLDTALRKITNTQ